jgi:hypothetical protein
MRKQCSRPEVQRASRGEEDGGRRSVAGSRPRRRVMQAASRERPDGVGWVVSHVCRPGEARVEGEMRWKETETARKTKCCSEQ